MRKLRHRDKLLLALATILLLSFIGTSGLNYLITKGSVHSEIIKNDLPLTMNNIYSDLTAELSRPILVASSMATDTFLKDWVISGESDVSKVQRYLLEIKERYGFFSTFFISASSLKYYHFKGLHKQIRPDDEHDIWYYHFISSGKEYDLDVDSDEVSNNVLVVFINYRVVDDNGQLLGVTGVGLKVESIAQVIQEYKNRYDRTVYLTDRNGLIQVHQDSSLIEKSSIGDFEGLKHHVDNIIYNPSTPISIEYLRNGEKILLNVRTIEILNWLLFVEQNETQALKVARMNFIRSLCIGLAATVIVIVLTLVTINRYQDSLEKYAISDELTGVGNRRELENEYTRAVYAYSRDSSEFSLVLIDIDKFKPVNDRLGHLFGDEVLRKVAEVISLNVRPTDTLVRWGGDEFAILVLSKIVISAKMAERVRISVERMEWDKLALERHDPRQNISLSCGVTDYTEGDSLDTMLLRADKALYRCKEAGGNKVEICRE